MKRISAKDHLGIAKKLAWSFHQSTKLPYEDLLSVGYEGLVQSRTLYTSKKGSPSTFFYHVVRSRLIDYCRHENYFHQIDFESAKPFLGKHANQHEEYCWKESLQQLSKEAFEVCQIIFESPADFLSSSKKASRGKVYRTLRKKGWSWPSIWRSFTEIKAFLNDKA